MGAVQPGIDRVVAAACDNGVVEAIGGDGGVVGRAGDGGIAARRAINRRTRHTRGLRGHIRAGDDVVRATQRDDRVGRNARGHRCAGRGRGGSWRRGGAGGCVAVLHQRGLLGADQVAVGVLDHQEEIVRAGLARRVEQLHADHRFGVPGGDGDGAVQAGVIHPRHRTAVLGLHLQHGVGGGSGRERDGEQRIHARTVGGVPQSGGNR